MESMVPISNVVNIVMDIQKDTAIQQTEYAVAI